MLLLRLQQGNAAFRLFPTTHKLLCMKHEWNPSLISSNRTLKWQHKDIKGMLLAMTRSCIDASVLVPSAQPASPCSPLLLCMMPLPAASSTCTVGHANAAAHNRRAAHRTAERQDGLCIHSTQCTPCVPLSPCVLPWLTISVFCTAG